MNTKYPLQKPRTTPGRKSMVMGDCAVCQERRTFVGRRCIRCGAMLVPKLMFPRAK